ncbi:MAG: hypothetical protein ACREYB_00360 [Casimicrobiaceae bacterium]
MASQAMSGAWTMRSSRTCRTSEWRPSSPSSSPRPQRVSGAALRTRRKAGELLPSQNPDPQCPRDHYSLFCCRRFFFRQALSANDPLRQGVAFALSQILVTSGLDVYLACGMSGYQQLFRDNGFANHETILSRVTMSSVMGD